MEKKSAQRLISAIYNHFIILYIYHILHFCLSRERERERQHKPSDQVTQLNQTSSLTHSKNRHKGGKETHTNCLFGLSSF